MTVKTIWRALAVLSAGAFLIGVTSIRAVGSSDSQEQDPPREGTCELAQDLFPDNNPGPGSLKEIALPEPSNLADYVRDRSVAIALGKALFWDMQVGSDGVQACASCHFRAGADPRSKNQLNPGGANNPDPTIDLGGPNFQLKASDFPLHKLADPTDRHSNVMRDSDDVVSSQGVHLRRFLGAEPGAIKDTEPHTGCLNRPTSHTIHSAHRPVGDSRCLWCTSGGRQWCSRCIRSACGSDGSSNGGATCGSATSKPFVTRSKKRDE